MATLYLHIGTHKTGTTAIQHFCEANKKVLAKTGYCFPVFPRKFKNIGIRQNGHFIVGIQPKRENNSFEEKVNQYTWKVFMHHIRRLFRKYPNIILSDELIWSETKFRGTAMWERLKEEAKKGGFDIQVIVYLRRQDEFLCSIWAQRIKNATSEMGILKIEEMFARAEDLLVLDYYECLEKIAGILDRDHITVRVYEREKFTEGDVRFDFLDTLGLSADCGEFIIKKQDPNPSLDGNILEIKRIINTIPDFSELAQKWVRTIAMECSVFERDRKKYSIISEEERDELLMRFEESNRCVARDYLHKEDATLFSPPGKLHPKWEADNPYMYEDIVRYFGDAIISIYNMQKGYQLKEKMSVFLEKAKWVVSIIYDYLFITK